MRNNILGGLVIFFVVVACLLMIDDISSKNEDPSDYRAVVETVDQQEDNQTDLAVLDEDEE